MLLCSSLDDEASIEHQPRKVAATPMVDVAFPRSCCTCRGEPSS